MTVVVAPSTNATPPVGAEVASSSPIPFRHTSAISGSEVSGILVATILVLCVFAATAWIARRKGWLSRWAVDGKAGTASRRSLVVLEVLRISRKTTIYRIGSGRREFLVAESSSQVVLAPARNEQESAP